MNNLEHYIIDLDLKIKNTIYLARAHEVDLIDEVEVLCNDARLALDVVIAVKDLLAAQEGSGWEVAYGGIQIAHRYHDEAVKALKMTWAEFRALRG